MGGSILREGTSSDEVIDLKEIAEEHQIVLVHGGGVEVTEIASKLVKEQKFIMSPDGFRSRLFRQGNRRNLHYGYGGQN